MNARMDVNMFIGRFPFRGVAQADAARTRERLATLGFARAVVSAMESVFQEDSYAAEAALARDLAGDPAFLHFKIVNPAQPWWQRDLDRARREWPVAGIRLCSTYHGYLLNSDDAAGVFRFAADHDLPVLAMCRMQDYRMHWLLKTPEAEPAEVEAVLERFSAVRLILAGFHVGDMEAMAESVNRSPNLLLDTSRLKGGWRTFERLGERLDLARIAFGSLWPINLPECPLEQVRHAAVPDDVKEAILGGNARRLLRL